MSTLTNIFASDDADPASDDPATASATGADIAPGTPGYDPDDPGEKPPEVLLPGEPGDPAA